MSIDRLHPRHSDLPDMSADQITGRRFGQSWRGYDADEVKQFLAQVAAQVRAMRERYESAETARREAEQRAMHPQIDEATLMGAVGEETAGILRSAHSAAAEITAKAEASAQAMVAAAEAKATGLVTRAESLLATRTAEADAVASEIRESALAAADDLREQAKQQANTLAEEGAQKYEETVQSAQALRDKILNDLSRRRKLATVQIEQLRAGRERLLDAYLVVRRTLDEVTDELHRADAEARAASDGVGRQRASETGELLDLRGEEVWNSLSPVGDAKAAGPAAPRPEPGENITAPVVMAPKVMQITSSPAAEATVLPEPDAIERVRIVRQEPATGTTAPAGAATDGTARVTEVPVTEGPVTEGPVTDSTARVTEGSAPDVSALDVPVSAADVPDLPADGGAGAEGAGAVTEGHSNGNNQRDVDSLFARIRASRTEATSEARKTLSEPDQAVSEEVAEPLITGPAGTAPDGLPTGEMAPAVAEAGADGTTNERDFCERRDVVTGRLESSLARKLKRALQDEQNSLLDRLRNLKGPATPANVLPNVEEHPDRFVDAGRPLLEEAARAGSQLAAAFYVDATVPTGLGPGTIEDIADELGKAIAEPLRQRLELAFRSPEEDPAELADALGSAYREWKTQRIEAAAHDQVEAAFCRGAYLAFPEGAVLRWVVDPTEGPCPDCEDNALAGNQAKGEVWPTGQLYPPAHPGCRCAVAPVPSSEVLPVAAGKTSSR